ncbi:MAG TPA: UPF0175 family protein [Candidatus Thermoplasmatota archaeon]|nr:UPF0175 family protein [Candidatus Thermoplasmatota archaeon]
MDVVKSVRLPAEIVRTVRERARRERVDESTAIRQLIALGGEHYAVELYRRGEVSLGEAARLAHATKRDMMEVLLNHGVKGNVTVEMQLEAQETMRRLRGQRPVNPSASSRS